MILTPTYHVMEMYNVHQGATALPLSIKSNDYAFGNEKLAAVSGSASKDKSGAVHISLTNIDAKSPQEISIDIDGSNFKSLSGRILKSGKLQDYNSFENPNKISPAPFKDAKLKGDKLTVKLPAFSVVVLELK